MDVHVKITSSQRIHSFRVSGTSVPNTTVHVEFNEDKLQLMSQTTHHQSTSEVDHTNPVDPRQLSFFDATYWQQEG